MNVTAITIMFVGVILAQPVSKPFATGGWLDLRPSTPQSRIYTAAANTSHVVVGMSSRNGSEVVVLDASQLKEISRWPIAIRPHHVAVMRESIIGTRVNEGGEFQACEYTFDGKQKGACISGKGFPEAIVSTEDRAFSVSNDTVWELDFEREAVSAHAVTSIPSEGMLLAVVLGDVLIRVDSMSLRASALNVKTFIEQPLTLESPGLAENRAVRSQDESLASHLVAGNRGEVLVFRGKYNAFTGLLAERFTSNGGFRGTHVLGIPQFPELRRSPQPGSLLGNPTGHMGTGLITTTGQRLLILDPIALRMAWYDVSAL